MIGFLLKRREPQIFAAILVLIALISTRFPGFAAPANLAEVFNDTAILIVLALGQMAVILTRCIDLSVAANLALSGMIVALLNAAHPDLPLAVLILVALVSGLLLGAINGLLVWKVGIPSIVVTLGTLAVYRGVIFLLAGGAWVNAHQMSAVFLNMPRSVILGLPVLAWTGVLIVALGVLVIRYTGFGRALYAVGGNPVAAVYAGLDVGRTQFLAFCLSGLLSGLCGYFWVSRYAVAYVDVANGFELDVIAACVIGGVSIGGGIGSVAGTVLGAIFLGVIKNALPVVNISPFWQMAISGSVIIIAVVFNARAEKKRGRLILKQARTAS
ncbi:rhamnose ABC transporter membrane protein [Faunimonas pinastri]|uniref:Autoinducer 2 import system permease protein LsrC n=1 Tax=Faunimonas pinastri TaxID=1855383 RepID=A0A1H9NUG0_9HYPH|nr:rhamnose ABC transporter membrane protein [Faunimonas pinastri]